ncbi:MAG: hypothetical protein R3F65_29170, partial [bacterium]
MIAEPAPVLAPDAGEHSSSHAALHAALQETLDAALDELAAGFDALCVLDAEGIDVAEAAERLAVVADRVAALAGAVEAPGHDEGDDEATLHAAGEALTLALDGLEAALGALDPADAAAAEALAVAADRVAAAAEIAAAAAREIEVWGFDLAAHAAPAGFASAAPRPAVGGEGPGREQITTVPLDAETAWVEWSITADGLTRAKGALLAEEPPVLTLRLYFEGDGLPAESVDVVIDRWVGRRRLDVHRPGAVMVCAVGLAAGGTFAHVARAVAVQMPTVGAGG